MKSLKITLLFFLLSVAAVAQSGMVFQGIARDNNSAAITDKLMTFTFRITKSDGTDLYKETQQIRTDNFGVYSHIIGTGNAVTNTFASVNFDEPNLKAIISVNNDGVDTQIYDQPFYYTAYAKYAQNGVPIGTVVAFMGDENKIPDGWMIADGRDITGAQYVNLRNTLGGVNNVPNLRGEYLKGAGTSIDPALITSINVRQRQIQNVGTHNHGVNINGATNNDGVHRHQIKHWRNHTPSGTDATGWETEFGGQSEGNTAFWDNTDVSAHGTNLGHKWASQAHSAHQHGFTVNGTTGQRQNQAWADNSNIENRPDSVGVYWIIRFK
ncbi:tail fiber protein [Polaribacter aestuariivivens]|uniref:Tail fiber protein n=1 Tax=Polaribacter aestuariivivens TaxID=2304626 RepID=A0A5S3NC39_9FLAO|nr:phage tail protein [Polaribacter aestuariivivens]TMM30536.1 tail fiber protein [Polaribacter aestuariivivens]